MIPAGGRGKWRHTQFGCPSHKSCSGNDLWCNRPEDLAIEVTPIIDLMCGHMPTYALCERSLD